MNTLTKNAIANSFMHLLSERPLNKIKVEDITSRCGVSRNTFYYHFNDIYDLLSYVFVSQLDTDWQKGLEQCLTYLYKNRRAVKNINQSLNKDVLVRFVNEVAFKHALTAVLNQAGEDMDPEVQGFLANFYKNALLGAITDWLSSGMNESPKVLIRIYNELFTGTFDAALEVAEKMTRRH
ncbi:MAG: TetR/AcrR family transcriptional regulator [Clostridia bacterium]|nr:TetR/AcrR family transcriptional regulator [Clostridia bacterium]